MPSVSEEAIFTRTVFKKSVYITLFAILIFATEFVVTWFILQKTLDHENDAMVINYTGIIRGSMQRAVKLSLALDKPGVDRISAEIESVFRKFKNEDAVFKINGGAEYFKEKISRLSSIWGDLKNSIYFYISNPSPENMKNLLTLSEKDWDIANETVTDLQRISDEKLDSVRIFFVIIGLGIALTIVLIVIIQRYVRKELEVMASRDPLTGAFNRQAYETILSMETKRSQRYGRSLSFIMYDIDHFKRVNDLHGHKTGDDVLKKLTDVVSSEIRESDFLCRIGGEEFIVVAAETDLENAILLAERMRKAVESSDFERVGTVTISAGAAQYDSKRGIDWIFKRMDAAMYRAKEKGRNRVEAFKD